MKDTYDTPDTLSILPEDPEETPPAAALVLPPAMVAAIIEGGSLYIQIGNGHPAVAEAPDVGELLAQLREDVDALSSLSRSGLDEASGHISMMTTRLNTLDTALVQLQQELTADRASVGKGFHRVGDRLTSLERRLDVLGTEIEDLDRGQIKPLAGRSQQIAGSLKRLTQEVRDLQHRTKLCGHPQTWSQGCDPTPCASRIADGQDGNCSYPDCPYRSRDNGQADVGTPAEASETPAPEPETT